MRIYAISWVMSSFIDYWLKKIFAQNCSLNISGFVFPVRLVSELNGIPVYTLEDVPLDKDALYVDFSNYQNKSDDLRNWANEKYITIFSLRQWLDTNCNNLHIDGVRLDELREIKLSKDCFERIDWRSGYQLRKVFQSYKELDFRSLFDLPSKTMEEHLSDQIKRIAKTPDYGNVIVHNGFNDSVASDLCKSIFSMRDINRLVIRDKDGSITYSVRGRAGSTDEIVIVIGSSSQLDKDAFIGQGFFLIRLDRGVLELDNLVGLLTPLLVSKIEFEQISSDLSHAFLFGRFAESMAHIELTD